MYKKILYLTACTACISRKKLKKICSVILFFKKKQQNC